LLTTIFVTALVLRLVNLASLDDVAAYAMIEDSPLYWNGATNWLDAGFFSVLSDSVFVDDTERVPLYHLFLIPFRWAFGDAAMTALIAQGILDSGTCVIIARIGAMIDRTTGIAAGLFAAAWFNLILHSCLILTDTLFLFLMCLMLFFATRFVTRRKIIDVGLAGLCCGLAIMTRPIAMLMPVAMAAAAPFIIRFHKGDWKAGFAAALAVLVMSGIPATPILYRNLTEFGTLQLTHQAGAQMLYWNVGVINSLASGRDFSAETAQLNEKLSERTERLERSGKKLTTFELSDLRMALAREELWKMPVSTLLYGWSYGAINSLASPALALDPRIRALNRNSFYNAQGTNIFQRAMNFVADNDPCYVSWLVIGAIGSIVALALQAYGWGLMLRRVFWPAFFGTLFMAYFLLISGPVGSPKYRLPFEPVLIIFQSFAVVDLASRLRRLWKRKTA